MSFQAKVTSVAALKTFSNPTTGDSISIADENIGGSFVFDSTNTETADDVMYIQPTVGSGRWIRQYDGSINIKWFGSDADAFHACLAKCDSDDGGTIYFPAGDYDLSQGSDDDFDIPSNVTIKGDGESTKIFDMKLVTCEDAVHVSIKDMNIRGYLFDFNRSSNLLFENVNFYASNNAFSASTFLRFRSCINVRVSGCNIYNCRYGIYLKDSQSAAVDGGSVGVTVENCSIIMDLSMYTSAEEPMYPSGYTAPTYPTYPAGLNIAEGSDVKFCNNHIEGYRSTSTHSYGIYQGDAIANSSRRILIEGNIIKNCKYGVKLHSAHEVTISKNTITNDYTDSDNNAFQAIGSFGDTDVDSNVSSNWVVDSNTCVQSGIHIANNMLRLTVSNNKIYKPIQGIAFLGDISDYVKGASITGNTVQSSQQTGINIQGSFDVVISDNRVLDGGLGDPGNWNDDFASRRRLAAVCSNAADNIIIQDNHLANIEEVVSEGNFHYGIWLSSVASYPRQFIVNNTIESMNTSEQYNGITAVPTAGTWSVGEKIYHSAPSDGGYLGWVCVVAGTPGTWEGFGLVGGIENITLDDITDVDTTGATQDEVLAYNASSGEWTPATIDGFNVVFDTKVTMAAGSSASDGDVAFLKGYYADSDGGGGTFVYDSSETGDNGGTIIGDAGTGAWVRQYDGTVSVKWFGAKGDDVTDDTTVIQAVLDLEFGRIHIPDGTYRVKDLNPPHDIIIECESADTIIKGFIATDDIFTTSVSKRNIHLKGGMWRDANSVWIHTGNSALAYCSFEDMHIRDVSYGWNLTTAVSNSWTRCQFGVLAGANNYEYGIYTPGTGTGEFNNNTIDECIFQYSEYSAIKISDTTVAKIGNKIEHCDFEDHSNVAIFIGGSTSNTLIHHCFFENNGGTSAIPDIDVYEDVGGPIKGMCAFFNTFGVANSNQTERIRTTGKAVVDVRNNYAILPTGEVFVALEDEALYMSELHNNYLGNGSSRTYEACLYSRTGSQLVQWTGYRNSGGTSDNDYTVILNKVHLRNTFQIDESTVVDEILDEDDLSSDSATALATQQSIKKYVDDVVINNLSDVDTTGVTQDQVLSYNASSGEWTPATIAGGSASLDDAYGNGNTIDVDGDPVTMTVSDTDNNSVLSLVQNDTTNNPSALLVENAGSGAAIKLLGAGSRKISSTAGNLTLETLTSGDIVLDSAANLDVDAQSIDLRANDNSGGFDVQGDNYLSLTGNNTLYLVGTAIEVDPFQATTGKFLRLGAGGGPGLTDSSGTGIWVSVEAEIAQSSTAGYTALLVDVTETSIGSGAKFLLDLQLATSTVFNVERDGTVNVTGTISATGVTSNITVPNNTQTTGNVGQIDCTPGSSGSGNVLQLNALGSNWSSGNVLDLRSADNSCFLAVGGSPGGGANFSISRTGLITAAAGHLTASNTGFIGANSNAAAFYPMNDQGVDGGFLLTGATSNNIVIAEQADRTFNFAHAQQTNPTLIIHSANQATDEWISFTHDQTNGVIAVGSGVLSIPGHITVTGNQIWNSAAARFNDDVSLRYGTGNDAEIGYVTTQTADALVLGVGADSNGFIICEKADRGFDFEHALLTDPTVIIHSHNQTTDEFIALQHNGTGGVLFTGKGGIQFQQQADVDSAVSAAVFSFDTLGAAEIAGSSGTAAFMRLLPEIEQDTTAGYTALLVDVTETGTGSGDNLLMDLQVESASQFTVYNNGDIEQVNTAFHYYGDPNANGSFRVGIVSGALTIQERYSGSWETIQTFNHTYSAPV